MGACAGNKSKPPQEQNPNELKKAEEKVSVKLKQQGAHHEEIKIPLENSNFKESYRSDDIGSLLVESNKKQVSKQLGFDAMKEAAERGLSNGKKGLSEIVENPHEPQSTFQNNEGLEEEVAEENVANFRNDQVHLNFQIKAS